MDVVAGLMLVCVAPWIAWQGSTQSRGPNSACSRRMNWRILDCSQLLFYSRRTTDQAHRKLESR